MPKIRLAESTPLDTHKISALITNQDDLFLVWPLTHYPFDHEQWQEQLNPNKGHKSFLIIENKNNVIGHAALIAAQEPGVYKVGFLYLQPEYRSRGLGTEMIRLLEEYAIKNLHAHQLTLVVRDYNPRAIQCYLKNGFKEYAREGTLIKMEKILNINIFD